MIYPTITEYIEAIRFSEDNFDKLTNLVPVLKDNGEPYYSSGNFAVVFKMKDKESGKLHAVKCFLKDQEGREESYRKISNYLETIENRYLIKTKFFEKELFVDTKSTDQTEFPVVVMDWVEGVPLDVYIREKINDKMYLEYLCYTFSLMAQNLIEQEFAHGDLKPDNILVKEDGMLVLVDYDGMYVPEMFGERSRELGSPDFQHPDRKLIDFDKHLDDFSLASILLSLKLISIDPKLLDKFGDKDRLLFSQKDYREFPGSKINAEIFKHFENKEVLNIYHLFLQALGRKMCVWNKELWKLEVPYDEGAFVSNDIDSLRQSLSLFDDDSMILFSNDSQIDVLNLFEFAKNNANAQYKLGLCYENGICVPKNQEKALGWFSQSARNGNSMAQYHLADYYYNNGPSQDYKLAVKWFAEASYQGDSIAQNMLGNCFYDGVGVPQDFKMAFKWYELSFMQDNLDASHNAGNCSDIVSKFECAESGDSNAQYELGECFELGKYGISIDMEKAISWYMKSAEQGNATAQYKLGCCYEQGNGVDKDIKQSIYWYANSSVQGNAEAQNKLGTCYYFSKDYVKAVDYYTRSANQNYADAQCNLGLCYLNGKGVVKDFSEAVKWLMKSAEQGFPRAQYSLGSCYYYGRGVSKDLSKAVELFTKSAEQNNADAQLFLGICYFAGNGVQKDYSFAVKWFSEQEKRGNKIAQFYLALCYALGYGVKKNGFLAIELLTHSAEQGYSEAQYNLGLMFYKGNIVSRDFERAYKWLSKSAEQGNSNAQYYLGECYEKGRFISKNLEKAIELYQKSSEQGNRMAKEKLADCYMEGIGVAKNCYLALDIYKSLVKDKPESSIMYKIGDCYRNGLGAEKNKAWAERWYEKARNGGNGLPF